MSVRAGSSPLVVTQRENTAFINYKSIVVKHVSSSLTASGFISSFGSPLDNCAGLLMSSCDLKEGGGRYL